MGRRSAHTPEVLSKMILDAAQAIIEEQGLAGLSAREVARRIGYSAGTIYNMFDNLDDVILQVEGRLLDALDARLAGVSGEGGAPVEQVVAMAQAYLAFTHERPKLWNLLFEHHMPASTQLPEWYSKKLETLLGQVERVMAPLFPRDDVAARQRTARVLWAGVHGITSLSTAGKLSVVTTEAAAAMIDDLVRRYLAGLTAAAGDRKVA